MKKITVTFNVEFGSSFQEGNFMTFLRAMLQALRSGMENSHNSNRLNYEIDTHDGIKRTKV